MTAAWSPRAHQARRSRSAARASGVRMWIGSEASCRSISAERPEAVAHAAAREQHHALLRSGDRPPECRSHCQKILVARGLADADGDPALAPVQVVREVDGGVVDRQVRIVVGDAGHARVLAHRLPRCPRQAPGCRRGRREGRECRAATPPRYSGPGGARARSR